MSNMIMNEPSLQEELANWAPFKAPEKVNQSYLFFHEDPVFGPVPMRLFIPARYKPHHRTPLVLVLHGAVKVSHFGRVVMPETDGAPLEMGADADALTKYLMTQGCIILRPIADPGKGFSWAGGNGDGVNMTYRCIVETISQLKCKFNIDDSRVYAAGHSDGGDGAFCMALFQPGLFAGIVIYNSLLSNYRAKNIYLKNAVNRPMYIVHSDLDHLRPMRQIGRVAEQLAGAGGVFHYKEYTGYGHSGKHVELDLPFANRFMLRTKRDPFRSEVYWEGGNLIDGGCDWLLVKDFDPGLPAADWHTSVHVDSWDDVYQRWSVRNYYNNGPGFAVKAVFRPDDNVFELSTSRVKGIEILISEKMVDLARPVSVVVDGRTVYVGMVEVDEDFIIAMFERSFDRQAIWVNAIKLDCGC